MYIHFMPLFYIVLVFNCLKELIYFDVVFGGGQL